MQERTQGMTLEYKWDVQGEHHVNQRITTPLFHGIHENHPCSYFHPILKSCQIQHRIYSMLSDIFTNHDILSLVK